MPEQPILPYTQQDVETLASKFVGFSATLSPAEQALLLERIRSSIPQTATERLKSSWTLSNASLYKLWLTGSTGVPLDRMEKTSSAMPSRRDPDADPRGI